MDINQRAEAAIESGRARLMAGVVFLPGTIARLAFLVWRGPKLNPDSDKYLTLAQNLLAHGTLSLETATPFAPSIRFPPLYPAFIAALSWSGHPSPLVIATVQAVLGALTAVMLMLMTRTFLPSRWAFLTALLYALHPGAIASDAFSRCSFICATTRSINSSEVNCSCTPSSSLNRPSVPHRASRRDTI